MSKLMQKNNYRYDRYYRYYRYNYIVKEIFDGVIYKME